MTRFAGFVSFRLVLSNGISLVFVSIREVSVMLNISIS